MAPSFEKYAPICQSNTRANRSSIVQSPQFTFFVGKDKTRITVHSAAMSWTSEPMNALINGGMKETRAKCAFLEHIEV